MRILCTGGAGFIGSNTVDLLHSCNDEVFIVDNFSTGKVSNINHRTIFECDILEYKRLEIAFQRFKPDAVLHLAAQSAITTSTINPQLDAQANILGTLNVIQLAKKYDVKRLVFSSTSAVYRESRSPWFGMKESFPREPMSPYGISKLAAEHYVRTMFPNHVIYRYGNVYGPKQVGVGENQVVARAFDHFVNDSLFHIVGNGRQKRDFIYVQDVAYANMLALYPQGKVGTYNLATGQSHSVNEVVEAVQNYYNPKIYHKTVRHSGLEDTRGSVYINNSKFKREFKKLIFTPLEIGIRKTGRWWQENKK